MLILTHWGGHAINAGRRQRILANCQYSAYLLRWLSNSKTPIYLLYEVTDRATDNEDRPNTVVALINKQCGRLYCSCFM
jgi:hypothetical protein